MNIEKDFLERKDKKSKYIYSNKVILEKERESLIKSDFIVSLKNNVPDNRNIVKNNVTLENLKDFPSPAFSDVKIIL